MTTFLAYLLIWVFPVLVFGGLVWLTFRRRTELPGRDETPTTRSD